MPCTSSAATASCGRPSPQQLLRPLLFDRRAAPPAIPTAAPAEPFRYDYDANAGGYTALLPLVASSAAVNSVLGVMETPERRVV
ncbi:hypothetical protein Q4I28_001146 [Leishmania naiffi]|uniref:Uncharacterized protein n=1 Tax=Leishmania naiffi TaxID=5678 RepID=A0AAW3C7R4_9TRYP